MRNLILILVALYSSPVLAGVGGAGNTGDLSIQFGFSKSTAILILKTVSPTDLAATTGHTNLRDFYTACRQTMFIGLVGTNLTLVEQISDGGKYHALARRTSKTSIDISRTQLEFLLRSGDFSASLLTAILLHEVGHDCVYKGKPVDDSMDPLLNDLAFSLIDTSGHQQLSHFLDLEFVSKVKMGQRTRLLDLSRRVQKILTARYLDYIGDWSYASNRSYFSDRPAPASTFMADPTTSIFLGWGRQNLTSTPVALQTTVNQILRAGFEKQSIVFSNANGAQELPTTLSCTYEEEKNGTPALASCNLEISWAPLAIAELVSYRPQILFTMDIFGEVVVKKLTVLH